jgi:glutamate-1-semialdehyde 2,1-aminomutase
MTATTSTDLGRRARAVIPGGMYGHQTTGILWPGAPEFMARGDGAHIWDLQGNRYIDLVCSYGPILHGHRHPAVEQAARQQADAADCQNMPAPVIVELAERMVSRVEHADWVLFMKNGTDATTLALTYARAATGRKKVLVAHGAYHGAAPWCTPTMFGVTEADRANLAYYTYNSIADFDATLAAAGADDVAAVIVTPFRHDANFDQELVDPAFARHLRASCDRLGALLIIDEVRCGLRLAPGCSWEPLGVRPDLTAWSKAIANGYPIAAVLGTDALRDTAQQVFATGSFWFSAVPMAAAVACLDLLDREDGVARMHSAGTAIVDGLIDQARGHNLAVNVTGHQTMPYLTFVGETDRACTVRFAAECARLGLFLHPKHNWFVSTAISPDLVRDILDITDKAFAAVKRAGGPEAA